VIKIECGHMYKELCMEVRKPAFPNTLGFAHQLNHGCSTS
jgi:hypothetical protein